MFFILNNSKTGMIAQQQKLDVISNNMVNINTHGYKKLDSSFIEICILKEFQQLNRNHF